jgi:hypothetical protein
MGFEVCTTEGGQVAIRQWDMDSWEPHDIFVDANQVPLLVQWLQEAAAELNA